MKQNQKNTNKGITLVALVITIIILLVLAGISIVTLTGNGLFEKARLAKQESKNAQEKEQGILGNYENKIGEYINGNRNESQNNHTPITHLANLTYNSGETHIEAQTRNLSHFNSSINIPNNEFLNFDTTTNTFKVKKTGNYIINFNGTFFKITDSNNYGVLKINNNPLASIFGVYIDDYTYREPFANCFNLYLYKGDTIDIEITNTGTVCHYYLLMDIYAN